MTHAKTLFAAAAVLSLACAGPALAASSASSASSDSIATSVGGISGSFGTSSNSSSKTVTAANGDYTIVAMAEAPGRDGIVRLTLQATTERAAPDEFYLYLPQATAAQAHLKQGGIVSARARPYGTEFAYGSQDGADRQAFYLVLADDWYRELRTQAVQL
jgi:hypothetical protein